MEVVSRTRRARPLCTTLPFLPAFAFLVESGTEGLSFGPPEKKMGWRGSDTRTVYFNELQIPAENVLGIPAKGFKQFLRTLTGGRITIGALSIGTAQGAYDLALKYSQEREAFGKSINKFQSISFKLADMATRIEASKHLVYHAAWRKDKNLAVIKEAAMAKLFSSETAMWVTGEAIQVYGGYGYIKEYDVERFFRDSKILEIGEGTSEIQRIIISREILKSAYSVFEQNLKTELAEEDEDFEILKPEYANFSSSRPKLVVGKSLEDEVNSSINYLKELLKDQENKNACLSIVGYTLTELKDFCLQYKEEFTLLDGSIKHIKFFNENKSCRFFLKTFLKIMFY